MPRKCIVINGRGLNLRGPVAHSAQGAQGGYSVKDYVPPEKGEHHMPFANCEGPGTHVRSRLERGVKATTVTDEGARHHDIAYSNIGRAYSRGEISKEQAIAAVRRADQRLVDVAKSAPSGPIESLHAFAAKSGIIAKQGVQALGLLNPLAFTTVEKNTPELPAPYNKEGLGTKKPKKPKKKDLVKKLRKRILSKK